MCWGAASLSGAEGQARSGGGRIGYADKSLEWMGEAMEFDFGETFRGKRFGSVTGTIVELTPGRASGDCSDGSVIFFTLEDTSGNTVRFLVTPSTYVVDFETLSAGMLCTFWYDADAPMPLIYPPQYNAVAAAEEKTGRRVSVGYFDRFLVNGEGTLQLNLDGSVEVRTTNHQYFQGSPADHNLVVVYGSSTRSIPAQTTPSKVVVLCG